MGQISSKIKSTKNSSKDDVVVTKRAFTRHREKGLWLKTCASPDARNAEAQERVNRLEAAISLLGPGSTDARLLQDLVNKAKGQCREIPVGERFDSCLAFVGRAQARLKHAVERTTPGRINRRSSEPREVEGRSKRLECSSNDSSRHSSGSTRGDSPVKGTSGRDGVRIAERSGSEEEGTVPVCPSARSDCPCFDASKWDRECSEWIRVRPTFVRQVSFDEHTDRQSRFNIERPSDAIQQGRSSDFEPVQPFCVREQPPVEKVVNIVEARYGLRG